MWLGPPAMVRKMQALALAGRCGGFGASGPGAGGLSSACNMALRATVPRVAPRPNSSSRRSVDINELVGVHQHQAQVRQRPRLRADVPRLHVRDEVLVNIQ